jgi:hypothetical protein
MPRSLTLSDAEIRHNAKKASFIGWAKTADRSARTTNARKAFEQKFLDEAGGDPLAAASLRKAYYANLVVKSVAARKRRRQAAEEARRAAIAELIAGVAS